MNEEISGDVLVLRFESGLNASWRYSPDSGRLDGAVAGLADLYHRRRFDVIRVLTDFAMQRIRDSAARAFADALVIRKKRSD